MCCLSASGLFSFSIISWREVFYICIPGFRAYERHSQLHTRTRFVDGGNKGYDGVYTSSFLPFIDFRWLNEMGWDGFWAEREQEKTRQKVELFFFPFFSFVRFNSFTSTRTKEKSENGVCLLVGWKSVYVHGTTNEQRETNRDMMMIMSKSNRLCDKRGRQGRKTKLLRTTTDNGLSFFLFLSVAPSLVRLSLSWDYWESGREEDSIGR